MARPRKPEPYPRAEAYSLGYEFKAWAVLTPWGFVGEYFVDPRTYERQRHLNVPFDQAAIIRNEGDALSCARLVKGQAIPINIARSVI